MAEPIRLIGLSLKGRNRIREHGDQWRVVKFGNPQCFDGRDGAKLESVETGHLRWVAIHNDRDFRIGT